jgi:DNA topoisomerase IB
VRLRRSDPRRAGYSRRRRGKGFSYCDQTGAVLAEPDDLARIRALVIPPAWRDVWICADPRGHIQAVGVDAAGRRQYRYHDEWRKQRDAAKFDHVLEVGERLPKVREIVVGHLGERGLTRARVLAAAVRLLDVGCFRVGGEEYAEGDEATFGLATIRREHVDLPRGYVRFCYPAKGGVQRTLDVRDDGVKAVVRSLLDRDTDQVELLAYRDGRKWVDVRSADINAYLREISGIEITAKDFRTWNGTVMAAVALAVDELETGRRQGAGASTDRSATARKRAVGRAMREVADYLGNTPTVARASYVDTRVIDLFLDGITIAGSLAALGGAPRSEDAKAQHAIEAAVLEMLRSE